MSNFDKTIKQKRWTLRRIFKAQLNKVPLFLKVYMRVCLLEKGWIPESIKKSEGGVGISLPSLNIY